MNLFLFLLFLAPAPSDQTAAVGQPMIPYTIADQHGASHTFTPGTRWVLFAFDKKNSAKVNDWLKEHPAEYLAELHMDFVVEISPMPGIIARKIAIPKMRKYPHQVLVGDDAGLRTTYLEKKKQFTLFQLAPDGVIEAIHHLDDLEAVQKLVQGS